MSSVCAHVTAECWGLARVPEARIRHMLRRACCEKSALHTGGALQVRDIPDTPNRNIEVNIEVAMLMLHQKEKGTPIGVVYRALGPLGSWEDLSPAA